MPFMVWQWAAGLPVENSGDFQTIRTRWLRGDLRWLRDNFFRVGRPDSVSRSRALWDFGTEFLRTQHYDCVDWHDLRPIVAELRTTARSVRLAAHRPPNETDLNNEDTTAVTKKARPRAKGGWSGN